MPVKLSAWSSLIQSGGNGGKLANPAFVAAGVAGRAPQFPTRQLSWVGSRNCRDAPLVVAGQGSALEYRTLVTVRWLDEFVPGLTSESVAPSVWRKPVQVSKPMLVGP